MRGLGADDGLQQAVIGERSQAGRYPPSVTGGQCEVTATASWAVNGAANTETRRKTAWPGLSKQHHHAVHQMLAVIQDKQHVPAS